MAGQGNNEARTRGARMLRTALGDAIACFLDDAAIVEVMLNPDGRLWIDRLSDGRTGSPIRASGCRRPMASASCAWSRTISAPRSMPVPRGCRPSCPRRGSGSRDCCRRWSPRRRSPSASPPSRCSRSTTMSRPASCRESRPRCCARASHSAPTSSSRVARRQARPRLPTRCSPRWRIAPTGWC